MQQFRQYTMLCHMKYSFICWHYYWLHSSAAGDWFQVSGWGGVMSPLQVFVSIKDLLDQVFLKTHGTNCSLQLWVCSFALLGCRILAKCSFFSAIMLVFFKSQCFTFIAWITWRIHWFELKNPTGTTEVGVGVGTYLLPLNMSLYIFSDKKLCHKSFTAGSSSCHSNCSRNCKTVVSI